MVWGRSIRQRIQAAAHKIYLHKYFFYYQAVFHTMIWCIWDAWRFSNKGILAQIRHIQSLKTCSVNILFFSLFLRPQWSLTLTKKPYQRMASQMPTLHVVLGVYSCSHGSITIFIFIFYSSLYLFRSNLFATCKMSTFCPLSCPFCAKPFSHYSLISLVCLVIVAIQ